MARSETTFIAIGGGDLGVTQAVLNELSGLLEKITSSKLVVMSVATQNHDLAAAKYHSIFKQMGVKHVESIDISQRFDSFDETSLKKIRRADAIFFTGGRQLNVTSLLGGSPMHDLIQEKADEGTVIAGTSAGAAMMSSSMIISGKSDTAPTVGGVIIGPGMNMIEGTLIDTHFSQRGRHGRLLGAVTHCPQDLGIGLDEGTAIVVRGTKFKVIGEGVVTVMDGRQMKHSDLPYRQEGDPIGMLGVVVHVLPSGYAYDLKRREPIALTLKQLTAATTK